MAPIIAHMTLVLMALVASPYIAGAEVRLGLKPDAAKRIWVRGDPPPPLPSLEMQAFSLIDPFMPGRLSGDPDTRSEGPTPPADLPWLKGMRYPDVPVVFDESVVGYLKWLKYSSSGRATARAWIRASGRFRYMILETLRRHRLPTVFLYVAMLESGYDPTVRSWAGAAGLWQFIKSGADIYGLPVNHWVDERLDPELSTEAAAYYLSDLLHRFGRWELALAAYNCGYGRVLQAMRRYGTNDYWKLRTYENAIPQESRLYVPKILALAIVDLNREKFGLAGLKTDPPYAFDLIDVPGGLRLDSIARRAGIRPEVLKNLNPEYVRGRLPPDKVVALRVPEGMGRKVRRAVLSMRRWWKSYAVHVLGLGETLSDVAAMYGTTRRALRRLNGIRAEQNLSVGTRLLVPLRPLKSSKKSGKDDPPFVAVPKGMRIPAGMSLYFYRTTRYDTAASVAAALGVSPVKLREWNDLLPGARLTSGMYLMVFVPKGTRPHKALVPASKCDVVEVDSDEFHRFYLDKVDKVRVVHRVRRGETLKSIARRYGSRARWIRNLNRLKSSDLTPGASLVVYARKSKVRRLKHSKHRTAVQKNVPATKVQGKKTGNRAAAPRTKDHPKSGGTEKTEIRPGGTSEVPGAHGKGHESGKKEARSAKSGQTGRKAVSGSARKAEPRPERRASHRKPDRKRHPRQTRPVNPSASTEVTTPDTGRAWTGRRRK